jgi:beta-RFAP synthase
VGTQLELALATAIARLVGLSVGARELAEATRRGRRSGIGVHGFAQGGFLIDGGKRRSQDLSVVRRHAVPEHWILLLLTPATRFHWHGDRERAAFSALGARSSDRMRTLLRSLETDLIAGNIRAFGSALTEYNALAGECCREVQLGRYGSPFVEEAIGWLRDEGAAAAGQSSWGPTVFSIWDDRAKLNHVQDKANSHWGTAAKVWKSSAANHGAVVMEQ